MKLSKKTKVVAGISLILLGLGLILACALRGPVPEITRTELDQLVQTKGISEGHIVPTPYAGIYDVEGSRKLNGKLRRFSITTHLDEAQITTLFGQGGLKVQIPGQGIRGQWVNIISTLTVVGLVLMLVVHQSRIGRGKNTLVKERPTVTFRDVAGIEEAKGEV
jgi:ATP-dependent Zn protease